MAKRDGKFRIGRSLLREAARRALALPVQCAARVEQLGRADGRLLYAPLFIIGPPRSGTTLVYQAICDSLHMAFGANLLVDFGLHGAPDERRASSGERGLRPSIRSAEGLSRGETPRY